MATTLIHQPLIADDDQPSPFDLVIREIVTGQDVVLAAPYVSWKYLRALALLSRSWRLLTDVEEWLSNEGKPDDAVAFLLGHLARIHHCPDLHAKIVASPERALIGSANLTHKGLTARQEMSVLLDEPQILEQLQSWFEGLWGVTAAPRPEDLLLVLDALPPRSPATTDKAVLWTPYRGGRRGSLTRLITPLRASLLKPPQSVATPRGVQEPLPAAGEPPGRETEPSPTPVDPTHEAALVSICQRMPSRNFANTFFDLVALFLRLSGLTEDDPRLACTIRRDGSRVTVQIGTRYVLTAKMIGPLGPHYGMIAPSTFCSMATLSPPIFGVYPEEFKVTAQDRERMGYMDVRPDQVTDIPEEVRRAWHKAILHELDRGITAPQQHRHRPVVLRAAVDEVTRERILRRAFPVK